MIPVALHSSLRLISFPASSSATAVTVPALYRVLKSCRADVYFITAEGDELNLKSTLSQFVFAAVCAGELRELKGCIQLEDPQDTAALAEYLTAVC